jgi:hypothetical protein
MTQVSDTSKTFKPAPTGLFHAVCVDEVDLGMQPTQWGPKLKVRLLWQIDERDEETGKRFIVGKKYTQSLADKSNLRHDLESWRGRPMNPEELHCFELSNVIGANCQIQIVHNIAKDGSGKVFANVAAIVPAPKGVEKIYPEDFVRWKDRPENQQQHDTAPGDLSDVPFGVLLPILLCGLAGLV